MMPSRRVDQNREPGSRLVRSTELDSNINGGVDDGTAVDDAREPSGRYSNEDALVNSTLHTRKKVKSKSIY